MTLYYTKEHEWIKPDDEYIYIGITNYAQEQLGDIVFIELPQKDQLVMIEDPIVVIESVKAAGEIRAPVNGMVKEINEALKNKPELVNEDPTGQGWLLRMLPADDEPFNPDRWMTQRDYEEYLKQLT